MILPYFTTPTSAEVFDPVISAIRFTLTRPGPSQSEFLFCEDTNEGCQRLRPVRSLCAQAMPAKKKRFANERLGPLILSIRGHRVILDADLARLCGLSTRVLNQGVRRNSHRFPDDFAFQLTATEATDLRSQFVTSGTGIVNPKTDTSNRSQIVTGSQKQRDPRFRPWAFTEHGARMAANVLRSRHTVQMSVYVIRAFVRLREQITANQAILNRLAEIDILGDVASERALWQLVEMPREARLDEGAQRGKRVLGSNVP